MFCRSYCLIKSRTDSDTKIVFHGECDSGVRIDIQSERLSTHPITKVELGICWAEYTERGDAAARTKSASFDKNRSYLSL